MSETNMKIFISMHDDFYVPDNELLYPIQVGCSIAPKRFDNMLHDDEGDNISDKNKMYCELTAQYWAWKNQPNLDYYGFFHYRRYLSFNPIQLEHWENIVYFDYCDDKAVEQIMLNEEVMKNLISKYDAIYPQENPIGGDTIYEHWVKHLEKRDIDLLVEIIMEKYPDFYEVTNEVLNAKQAIHCNMFIMKREHFMKYSEWLFDILAEHERRSDHSNYSTEKYRTMGHLAERLCAIYSKYLEKQNLKICYVQRTMFRNTEKNKEVLIENKENFIPMVMACNNGYVKYTSVLIESILKNVTEHNKYSIYILHTDITKENMKILEEQVVQKNNVSIDFINVKRRLSAYGQLFVDRHLSIETYFRFFAMDIFPNLKKILYMDCDTVVNKDVAELFNVDLEGKSLGAVKDVDIISLYPKENLTDPEVHNNIDINIGLEKHTDYFQAGVLVFNLEKMRTKYNAKDFFDQALNHQWKFQDQDILNYMFKKDVKYLDMSWNVLYECFNRMERVKIYTPRDLSVQYINAKENPGIIHYAGTPKPWNNVNVDMANYFWSYAKSSPFFEILMHDMNLAIFKAEKPVVATDTNNMQHVYEELNDLRWRLSETRKSFSYRLAMAITYIPRKIRSVIKGE